MTSYLSDLLSSSQASVVTRAVGTFHFDAVTAEGHTSSLRLTENPIESGAAIADHAILEPKEISIVGVMVGHEPPGLSIPLSDYHFDFMRKLPLPISIKSMTAQSISAANRFISIASDAQASLNRTLAPFLPDYQMNDNDFSPSLDRVGKAYNTLLNLQKCGETITVQTGLKLYENMMLIEVGVTQTADGSAEFSLTLREVFIVENKMTSGIHPDMKKAKRQKNQMGRTQPTKTKTSALKDIFG